MSQPTTKHTTSAVPIAVLSDKPCSEPSCVIDEGRCVNVVSDRSLLSVDEHLREEMNTTKLGEFAD